MLKTYPQTLIALLATCLLGTAGCNKAPVLNVSGARFPHSQQVETDEAWAHDVLVEALALKGWTIHSDQPGKLEASVHGGGHSARIRIRYTGRKYSIQHLSSSPGLKYDGQNIHRRYNHWIDRLQNAINNVATQNSLRGPVPTPVEPPPDTASNPPPAIPPPTLPPPPPALPPAGPEQAPEGADTPAPPESADAPPPAGTHAND